MPEVEPNSQLPGKAALEPPPAGPRLAPGLLEGGVLPPPTPIDPANPPTVPPAIPVGVPPAQPKWVQPGPAPKPESPAPRNQSPLDMIP